MLQSMMRVKNLIKRTLRRMRVWNSKKKLKKEHPEASATIEVLAELAKEEEVDQEVPVPQDSLTSIFTIHLLKDRADLRELNLEISKRVPGLKKIMPKKMRMMSMMKTKV